MDWTHRLRLRHLQMLLSLAETGNMSQTAAALHLTQPALSRWLRELEDDIGLPLFERHARGLRPTSYGETLIAHARRLEAHLDGARDDLQALRDGGSGLVAIGTSAASATETVPFAVVALMQRMPGARVRLTEGTMNVLMPQLAQGQLDIVVGRSAPEWVEPQLRGEGLYEEAVDLVVRPGHPLFDRPSIGWDDLAGRRWLLWPRGTPIRNALDAALATAGVSLPPDSLESNSLSLNMTLLNQTDLIGQASRRSARWLETMGLVRTLPLALSGFGSVSMYWRADIAGRGAVERALECLREAARREPGPAARRPG